MDFSGEMLAFAHSRHPELNFYQQDVQQLDLDEKFDYIILSDLINDVEDVQKVFEVLKAQCDSNTRIVLNFYSYLWSAPLSLAQKIAWATPTLLQNWLNVSDFRGLMELAGLEPIRNTKEVLWPVKPPFIDSLFNRYLVRKYIFKTSRALQCRCDTGYRATIVPFVYLVNLNKEINDQYVSRPKYARPPLNFFKRWQEVNETKEKCIKEIISSCKYYFITDVNREVIGIMGAGIK